MKIWLMVLCLLLLGSVSGCAVRLDAEGETAYAALKSVSFFGTGGMGIGGVKSDGEKALRVLLKQKQAENALQSLLKEANPVSQMYALAGLKSAFPKDFDKSVIPFLTVQTKIRTMQGCLSDRQTVAAVAADIRKGNYRLRPENQ